MRILLASTALIASLSCLPAMAADPYYPGTGQTQVEYGSGWYLRGDIAYNAGGKQKIGYDLNAATGDLETFEFDNGMGVSIGFGKYVNNYLRWDVNYEALMRSESTSTENVLFRGVDTTIPAYVDIAGKTKIESTQSIDTYMANAFADLGTYGRFTPYVGAGLGFASVDYTEKHTDTCSPGADVYCGDPAGGVGEEVTEVSLDESQQKYVLAYSVSAGASVDIAPKLKLDMSYQYLNVDDGSMLNGSASEGFSGVQLHRAKLGLRYDIW
jgi:opacity protein-like surface antigen